MKNEIRKCQVCGLIGKDWRVAQEKDQVFISKKYNGFFCGRHYRHMQHQGKILERTRYDKNSYTIENNIVYLDLYSQKNIKAGVTLFSVEHLVPVLQNKWCLQKDTHTSYAYSKINGKTVRLHVFIKGSLEGKEVDHIDGNGLNNVDNNLRFATRSENASNIKTKGSNTSGYIGVKEDVRSGRQRRWSAVIKKDNKTYYSGKMYKTKEEAIAARIELEKKYHGEFANSVNKKRL